MIKFSKEIGKTIGKGQITVPKEFDSLLDKERLCLPKCSIDVIYVLPNGFRISGRLYQSENNSTNYYQFYIIEKEDKKYFEKTAKNSRFLTCVFAISKRLLHVNFS